MTALDKPRPILTPTISVHGRWRFLVVTLSRKVAINALNPKRPDS